ncbi:MAG: SDR family NAD(P)-dependent oxidoreductase [Chloroflexota bacterium]|jgi:NAD(P)-dependent dehydrogenase (short-subunit alcohol dehydrogenase family)|tara:strand:- start:42859 stop:43704 length:846 start_codon:yes stop_codon:yes gene_type:complete
MLKNKNVLLTGATSGIGIETAKLLISEGAKIIGIGSSKKSCANAYKKLEGLKGSITFIECDLSDQDSIHNLTGLINEQFTSLDCLINNAGAIYLKFHKDKIGIEKTFSVNYLGHYLLTRLLLPNLMNAPKSIIVNVTSVAYKSGSLNLDELRSPNITAKDAYTRSKLAQVLFTQTLAKKLNGSTVSVNCLHPGLIGTNLLSKNGLIGSILTAAHKIVGRSAKHGAEHVMYNVRLMGQNDTNGQYYSNSKNEKLLPHAVDNQTAEGLWEISSKLCDLPIKLV